MKKNGIVMFLVLCIFCPVRAEFVFHETFETNEVGLLVGQNGWNDPRLSASVQSNEAWELDQAVSFRITEISHGIGGSNDHIQVAFAWKPVAGDFDGEEIPTDASVVFWVDEEGRIAAYSNQALVVVSGSFVDTNAWNRVLVESDYAAKQWSLWLDGEQVVDGFGFYTNTLEGLTELMFRSADSGIRAYIDDIIVNATNLWIPHIGDTDGDGLQDEWEMVYFRTPHTLVSSSGDYDYDGQNNGDEEVAGSDPTDSNSLFEVNDAMFLSSSQYVIHWSSEPGRIYEVDISTNMMDGVGWSTIESTILATPPENVYTVMVDSAEANFIRVKAIRE